MKIFVNHDDETAYMSVVGMTSGGNSKIVKIWLDYDSLDGLGLEFETDNKNREFAVIANDSYELEPVVAEKVRPAIFDTKGNLIVPEYRSKSAKQLYKLVLN